MNTERRYYTVAEVSALFGVSTDFVYASVRAGQLRAIRLQRVVRIPLEAVDEWATAAAEWSRER